MQWRQDELLFDILLFAILQNVCLYESAITGCLTLSYMIER